MEGQTDRRATMLALVQQWRESGKGARAFAREHDVTPWRLYYWRDVADAGRATTRRRRRSSKHRSGLVPVRVIGGTDDGGELEVILAAGDRLRVPANVSLERLQRVLQIVKTC